MHIFCQHIYRALPITLLNVIGVLILNCTLDNTSEVARGQRKYTIKHNIHCEKNLLVLDIFAVVYPKGPILANIILMYIYMSSELRDSVFF